MRPALNTPQHRPPCSTSCPTPRWTYWPAGRRRASRHAYNAAHSAQPLCQTGTTAVRTSAAHNTTEDAPPRRQRLPSGTAGVARSHGA
eukprot:865667-Prymnesium_polylepis.1